jgi:hypothetical protein
MVEIFEVPVNLSTSHVCRLTPQSTALSSTALGNSVWVGLCAKGSDHRDAIEGAVG